VCWSLWYTKSSSSDISYKVCCCHILLWTPRRHCTLFLSSPQYDQGQPALLRRFWRGLLGVAGVGLYKACHYDTILLIAAWTLSTVSAVTDLRLKLAGHCSQRKDLSFRSVDLSMSSLLKGLKRLRESRCRLRWSARSYKRWHTWHCRDSMTSA
jgi:hypothetical protein